MARILTLLLCGLAAASIDARAAANDDGFVWVDANTKIKLKPVGSTAAGTTAGSAAAGETKTPEPKKAGKKEKAKK